MSTASGCSLCSPELGPMLREGTHWRLVVNWEQDLLGASFLALRRHAESPTDVRPDEWSELHGAMRDARDLGRLAPDQLERLAALMRAG